MTDTATTSTSIDVATDPSTAFTVFTDLYQGDRSRFKHYEIPTAMCGETLNW